MNTLDRAKYRGKRIDTGEWVYGFLSMNKIEEPVIVYFKDFEYTDSMNDLCAGRARRIAAIDPKTVGQFTGVSIDGSDIFEGDVCTDSEDVIYGIKWNDYQAGFHAEEPEDNYRELFDLDDGEWLIEIKGNIHDNPELLEVSK